MIKLFKFFLLIVSPLFCLNALAHQLTINISASVIARSCEIANDIIDFTVNMETGNLKQSAIGVPFVETPFSIKLQNCPESVKIAHIKFTGNSDMSMPDYIQTITETGSAKGVAIGLYDKNKTNISILNGTTDFTVDSTLPENTLSFIAAYVRTSNQFSSGTVTAVVNFELSYD